jgi:hypothetical protein
MSRLALALAVCALLLSQADAGRAEVSARSELALARVAGGESPDLLLAQRVLERDWGPENDSLEALQRAQGWRSEPVAFALSSAVPGAGQMYSGEGSGVWFALAEVAGWTARWFFHRNADRDRDKALQIAGNPADSTSGWSFSRWESANRTRRTAELEALYQADPGAFYALIANDPQYLDGWGGNDPAGTRDDFQHQRDLERAAIQRARGTEVALALNHLVSAWDALRLARLHNLPIRRNLDLELRGSWHRGGPTLLAVFERRF